MKTGTRILSAAAVSAFAAVATAQPSAAQTISFASLPQGSLIYFQATVISKMLLDKTDLKVRVAPMSGTEAIIAAAERKQAEMMLLDVTQAAAAINGEEHFKGRPATKLRAIAKMVTFPVGIMVKKDSKYKTIADLKGAKLPTGWRAFRQGLTLMKATLATGGLTLDDISGVPTVGLIRAADDFKSGRTVGTLIAPTTPKVKEVNAALGGIRFISIGDSEKSLKALQSVRKDFYIVTLKPAPYLPGILTETSLLAFDLALSVGAHVSDEVAYKIAKAVYENKKMLAQGHPTFRSFNPKQAGKQFSVLQYHPGAIKFYKEVGIWQGK